MKALGRRAAGRLGAALLALVAAPLAVRAQGVAPDASRPPLSPRNASYSIRVALDPAARQLEGSQRVTWRNIQQRPTAELRFHLYWNAFRNERSTWMLEDRFRRRSSLGDEVADDDWGYVEVDAMRLVAAGDRPDADLLRGARFESPDDGNPDDRTVLVAPLPREVAPGETVEVDLEWHARVPRTFARTGYRGDYYLLAHWFPKLGVFEADGWNCRQFHSGTEFFSDYGVYDVSITVPAEYVVGATGRLAESRENGDGTVTVRHVQEDVHAFSWTASPDFVERLDRFEAVGLPSVDIRLLLQPEHAAQAERHLAAVGAALERYGHWFGPYPYGHLTVVDPAYGSGTGGMEYPTLITCGTRLFNPPGGGSPEGVTVHETGHQFWYAVVGNNEFDHAWLDEGLNSYSAGRVYEETFGERVMVARYLSPPSRREGGRGSGGFLPWRVPGTGWREKVENRRFPSYRAAARAEVQADPSWTYFPEDVGGIAYSKTAIWLATLERHLGWEAVRDILSTFYRRYAFRHPTPQDFRAVAGEVSGRELDWFFDQVLSGEAVFDYAVARVATGPAPRRGFFEQGSGVALRPEGDGEPALQRSEVLVRRLGDGRFPVDVLLAFDDGSELRERWDGEALWKLWQVERPARLEYAVVDPERVLLLDVNFTNNSRRVQPVARLAAAKWASKWMVWFQDLLAAFASFV